MYSIIVVPAPALTSADQIRLAPDGRSVRGTRVVHSRRMNGSLRTLRGDAEG